MIDILYSVYIYNIIYNRILKIMINIIHELGTRLDQPVKWGDREISEIQEFFSFELEEKMEYQMIRRWAR